MRVDITRCYNCICNACNKRKCPYPNTRCQTCTTLSFRRTYDCDYFESRYTAPKYFRIRRKVRPVQDALNQKLDYIIDQLGMAAPVIETVGVYAVLYEGFELFEGSHADALAYITRMQSGFNKRLQLKKLVIEF